MNIFNAITVVIMMIQFLILTDNFRYSGCGVISTAAFLFDGHFPLRGMKIAHRSDG